MTTIDPSLESELIRRFPFSPKVRPIAAERMQDDVQIHHARTYSETDRSHFQFHTPEKVKSSHAMDMYTMSTAEKSINQDEKHSSPSELAKLNAKLEEMIMRNSYVSNNAEPERKSLYESAIINHPSDNIIVRADQQILKSQNLYGNLSKSMTLDLERELHMRVESRIANMNAYQYTFSPKKSEYGDDLLRVEDLKTSQIIETDIHHLWATQDPNILRIIDEIKGKKYEEVKIVTNEEQNKAECTETTKTIEF
jgi:hypothetical protein